MFDFHLRTAFGTAMPVQWSMLSTFEAVTAPGGPWLYTASASTGVVHQFRLAEGAAAVRLGELGLPGAFPVSGLVHVEVGAAPRMLAVSHGGARPEALAVGPGGGLSRLPAAPMPAGATVAATVEPGGNLYIATAAWDAPGITLSRLDATGQATAVGRVGDTAKSRIGSVTDLIEVQTGGRTFLLAASTTQNGLTSYEVGPGGALTLADSIGTKDGLWLGGVDAIDTLRVGGVQYVVAASTAASTLAVVRVNDLGVMFVASHANDTLDTRFDRVTAVETFTAQDRGFVLAAGTDGGVTLFELIPGGRLFHHVTIEQQIGWTLANVGGLHVEIVGNEVQVFVTSASQPGLTQFALPLADLGPRRIGGAGDDSLTGTGAADMLIGFSGNDTLTGGAGDDVLIGGAGSNRYSGGPGADTFVLAGGGQPDLIVDFEHGTDRLDLSGWGRLYDVSALGIRGRSNGAEISFGSESVRIVSADSRRIDPSDWSNDDFLF